MDSHTKTGKVYLQPHRAGKKWKPVWLSLFPASSSAVGRLEIQDMGGGAAGGGRHYQAHVERKLKVVRLSELISVLRLPPNAEACPMDNMAAFCVETPDRTMVFAALKDDCVDWVHKLCHSTFQRAAGSPHIHMEENQIYASADEASEFWVTVQRTDAATRCGLKGSYWLQVGREALLLRETQRKVVREWPYELLRRYGRDKLALTIEAGRRCDSGPGTFTFETQQAENIFSLIQSTIRQKTSSVSFSSQTQGGERVPAAGLQAPSPLLKEPDGSSIAAILEDKLRTLDSTGAAVEEDLVGSSESGPVQPAPITLMPLPLVPSHGAHLSDQSDAVYADPADCIQPGTKVQPTTALYVDPACYLPLKPPISSRESSTPPPSSAPHPCSTADHPDPVYSEVYDKISPVQVDQIMSQGDHQEPIYTEPVGQKEDEAPKGDSRSDPFAHLYAQVCKTKPSSSPSSSSDTIPSCSASSSSLSTTHAADQSDDVIYENLGII